MQELGLNLHLGNDFLQFQSQDYSILSAAQSQVSDMPSTRSLYKRAKDELTSDTESDNEAHLNQFTVQCIFLESTRLEISCTTWNLHASLTQYNILNLHTARDNLNLNTHNFWLNYIFWRFLTATELWKLVFWVIFNLILFL